MNTHQPYLQVSNIGGYYGESYTVPDVSFTLQAKQALAPALKFKAVDEKAFDKLARNVERLAAGSVATTEFVARVF